jgi:hypothetical protein
VLEYVAPATMSEYGAFLDWLEPICTSAFVEHAGKVKSGFDIW